MDILSQKSNVSLIGHDITKPVPDDAPDFDYIIHDTGDDINSVFNIFKHFSHKNS